MMHLHRFIKVDTNHAADPRVLILFKIILV